RDVGRLLLPATEEERLRLVFQTRAGQIIQGVRGQHKLDVERLLDFLKLVSDWIVQEPQIESMDFN
ncbi:MAG: hypothetical protein GWM98_01045, partial [Nitrospinaceae bacterium]|nr:hypothetical protein [Nitrospinaceae bacterium]NIR53343.1 hypothetical protein [Nitrospinaceae bacterium]NIS83743.1 hypothetical protein [Nitrospinaceae bacterium]NIT80542.1 hypothetical protein [Nitrospinaceae bacterium]NIU42867.1 hypothetical protein [Nitrospinaceae bacterium]